MTSSLPEGSGLTTNDSPGPALDEDAAPATGLEPDTAANAAGEGEASPSADVDPNLGSDDDEPAVART